MSDEILKSLAANSPWALATAFLMREILKAWNADRASVTELLSGFKGAIDALREAVDKLSARIDAHDIELKRKAQ